MPGKGTATLSFGTAPGTNIASVAVTGIAAISPGDYAEAFLMADTSADHNTEEHRLIAGYSRFCCDQPVTSTGFTITMTSDLRLTGDVAVRWVWS